MLVKGHLKKGDNKQRYCGEKKGARSCMSAEGELQQEWIGTTVYKDFTAWLRV